ncbi:MAG: peptidoglycan DD-metalloendopeptidase family protein [Candidatus Eisenbacteria bacterium]|nr:peptidoglycan DD-metalloendopeptidase family protein [Candidatus Eisenbacteria bacterium]
MKARRIARFLPWAAAFLLAAGVPALLAASEEEEMEKLRRRIRETRSEVEQLAGKESGILTNLMKLDEDLALTNRLLSGLEQRRRNIESGLEELTEDAREAEEELGRRRSLLRDRLRALYQYGGYHEFEILFSSRSVTELVGRFENMVRIVSRDDNLYRAVLDDRERVRRARDELAERDREIRSIEAERARERRALLQSQAGRRKLLQDVRGEKESHERLIAEMEEASRELERIIASRVRDAEEIGGPSLFDGGAARLPWPVGGSVVRGFGSRRHPEFGTVVRNNGIDIDASGGAEIRSVAPGKVEYVSTLPGYGNCIIVRHSGGYYTLYAHASEVLVAAGARVAQGDVLATVGGSGSATGGSFHFEIRKGTEPLDPLRFLREIR